MEVLLQKHAISRPSVATALALGLARPSTNLGHHARSACETVFSPTLPSAILFNLYPHSYERTFKTTGAPQRVVFERSYTPNYEIATAAILATEHSKR